MPVIREYSPQTGGMGPINQPAYSAEQFGAAQGRALENLGQAVGNVADSVAKRIDQQNTSDITQKLTAKQAELSTRLRDTIRSAQPGDSKPFEDYQKQMEDEIGKIGEEASTLGARNFFNEASIRIKGQLSQTAAEGQSELAGMKAVNDYTDTVNNLSSTVLSDPSSLALQKEIHSQTLNKLVESGQLPASKAMQLKREGELSLAKSTVRGWMEIDPVYAKKKLKDGEFDTELGAEGKRQMLGEIDQAERAREIEEERRIRLQERAQKQQQQQTQNDFLKAMVDKSLTTQDILNSNLEAFGSGSKEQFLSMLKTANQPEERLKTDPNTMITLFNRIHLPDGDPNKLTDENELNQFFGSGLSMTDMNKLRDEMQGTQTEAGRIESDMKKQVLEIARGKLTKSNPLTGFKDPIGDENMARFMTFFFEEYKSQRAAGVPSTDLLNPDSERYLGRNINQYIRSPQQIMRDLAPRRQPKTGLAYGPRNQESNAAPRYQAPQAPKPQPKKPGESAADYLKRIKGGQ